MKIRLTILNVGKLRDASLRKKYKNYCCMFSRIFKETLGKKCELYISCITIMKGQLPSNIDNTDIWAITGSKNSVFDEEEWVINFRHLVKEIYHKNGLIVGFCFGHQIMADVLGGRVSRYDKGWGLGIQDFESSDNQAIFNKSNLSFPVCYQDQVIKQPKDTKVILSSDFCKYAGLVYPNGSLSVQFHPEFSYGFISELIGLVNSENNLSSSIYNEAVESLKRVDSKDGTIQELDNDYFFETLSNYLISNITARRARLKAS